MNYQPLIDTLTLPDIDDRHVLAAAIKTNADLIITNNLKDFPADYFTCTHYYERNCVPRIDLTRQPTEIITS